MTWRRSTGNAAGGQIQYDASLDPACWDVVRSLADHLVFPPARVHLGAARTTGSGLGRHRSVLALDRAIWIARGWRAWSRRGHWKQARDEVAARILGALDDDGGVPQSYDDKKPVADASALMVVVFGMLRRGDPGRDGWSMPPWPASRPGPSSTATSPAPTTATSSNA